MGIALDLAAGQMYWTAQSYRGDAKIRRADLDGTYVEDLVELGSAYPMGIRLDLPAGKMYWTNMLVGGAATVQRADLDGSNVEDLITGLGGKFGLALDLRASGDCDLDSVITLSDHEAFTECMAGPAESPPADCGCVNPNGDDYVDLADFAAFQRAYTGP